MEITTHTDRTPQRPQSWCRLPAEGPLAGVCAGVAARHGVDPLLVRVAAVILAFGGGLGAGAYLAAWAMLPAQGEDESLLERTIPSTRQWSPQTRLLAGGLAALVIASPLASGLDLSIAPLLVLGVVVWLVRRNSQEKTSSPMPPQQPLQPALDPSTDFGQAALTWQQRLAEVDPSRPAPMPWVAGQPAPTTPIQWHSQAGATAATKPARRRPSGWVGLVWIGMAIAVGIAVRGLAGSGEGQVLAMASALAVISLGLLVGTFTGRPRGLVLAGLLTAVSVFAPLAAHSGIFSGEVGNVTHHYRSVAEIPTERATFSGADAVVDLSELDLSASGGTYRMRAYGSDVTLLTPREGDTVVRYTLYGSDLTAPEEISGTEPRDGNGSGEFRIDRPGENTLVVEVELYGANMEVLR